MAVKARAIITLARIDDGISVRSVIVEYYLSTSATSLSGGSWTTSVPAWVNGKFIWSRQKTTLSNGTVNTTNPVCITGGTGATGAVGTGITSITTEYYLSTSKTTQTGGSWITTQPTWSTGKYLWTRSKIVYKNPTSTTYTTPICDSSWEAVNDIEIGGINFLLNSSMKKDFSKWTNSGFSIANEDGYNCAKVSGTLNITKYIYQSVLNKLSSNTTQTYVISAWVKCVNFKAGTTNAFCQLYFSGSYNNAGTSTYMGATTIAGTPNINSINNKGWAYMTWVVKFNQIPTAMSFYVYCRDFTGDVFVRDLKMEKGNKATAWSSAPEDINQDIIDTELRITESYNNAILKEDEDIKLFVEKSVEAIGDWESAVEKVKNEMVMSSDYTEFVKTSTETLKDLQSGKVSINELREYIKFDGAKIILGTNSSNFKTILTNTELGFYEGTTRVAWISNNELHTLNINAEESVRVGRFKNVDEGDAGYTLKLVGD